ncbi:MAG: hypothetical protein L6V95_04835 [Candidatus Melainabacteria bacterium]|nr:MAG: hypothetical protein L6V95_04835 [Candidatus Melainabacteria bacterium]
MRKKTSFINDLKEFFLLSPEVGKICLMQFFTWIGTMCMMIFFTQYTIHTIYGVPDLTSVSEAVKNQFANATLSGTNLSSIGFAAFNLICFIISIPIGLLSSKFGNKKVHIVALLSMALSFLGLTFVKDIPSVMFFHGACRHWLGKHIISSFCNVISIYKTWNRRLCNGNI